MSYCDACGDRVVGYDQILCDKCLDLNRSNKPFHERVRNQSLAAILHGILAGQVIPIIRDNDGRREYSTLLPVRVDDRLVVLHINAFELADLLPEGPPLTLRQIIEQRPATYYETPDDVIKAGYWVD